MSEPSLRSSEQKQPPQKENEVADENKVRSCVFDSGPEGSEEIDGLTKQKDKREEGC